MQRPKEIVFTCADAGLLIRDVRWSSWGRRVAVGRAVVRENLCDPFCVSGNFRVTGVTVHLFKRRVCPGRSWLYYRAGTLIEAGGRRTAVHLFCPS